MQELGISRDELVASLASLVKLGLLFEPNPGIAATTPFGREFLLAVVRD